MIRPYQPADLEAIVSLVGEGTHMPADEVRTLVTERKTSVYVEAGAIRGIVSTTTFEDAHGLRLYVGPRWRGSGIGGALYDFVRPEFDAAGPYQVNTTYRADDAHGRGFFERRGFTSWYGMTHLSYQGPRQPESEVTIRPYEDSLFYTYIRVLGKSFAKMRADHGFEPYDVEDMHDTEETRAEFARRAGDLFLAFNGDGEAVGCADIQGDYIDIIGVLPGHQGRGYGRALTRFAMNVALDRAYPAVRTSVVTDNNPAHTLYLSLGFRETEAYEMATLRLKK